MKIEYIEQVHTDNEGEYLPIEYKIEGLKIIATFLEIEDTFDFSEIEEDGEINVFQIETKLKFVPIASAKRLDGEWFIELIKTIPMEVVEYE
jgi:hypothetical protein